MAYERRDFEGAAVATTLSATITSGATSFTIVASTGWPDGSAGDFFARIENETIRCASRSGTTVTVATDGRGYEGTTAAAHTSGVAVSVVAGKTDLDEANYAVSQTVGAVTSKGDLLVATGTNVLDNLTVGTNDYVLTADSAQPTGVKWAAVNLPSSAWTPYTPTWSNGTIGNATVNAKYMQLGSLVIYQGRAVAGSTTAPSTAFGPSVPVAADDSNTVGSALYIDASTSTIYVGACLSNGSSSLVLYDGDGLIDGTSPITWATGDFIHWSIVYEAA